MQHRYYFICTFPPGKEERILSCGNRCCCSLRKISSLCPLVKWSCLRCFLEMEEGLSLQNQLQGAKSCTLHNCVLPQAWICIFEIPHLRHACEQKVSSQQQLFQNLFQSWAGLSKSVPPAKMRSVWKCASHTFSKALEISGFRGVEHFEEFLNRRD